MTNSYTGTHIVQITDTTDSGAILKIRSAYAKHLGRHGLRDAFVDVEPATNTLSIGVKASELVHNSERPDRLLLALNCAPPDKDGGTQDNHRKDFYFADLGGGVYIGGTINGLELSYLKGEIRGEIFRLTTTNRLGSQFRSLQVLPEYLVRFSIESEREALIRSGEFEPVAHPDRWLPDVPDVSHVIEVDNFKNVKLFTSRADKQLLKEHQRARAAFGSHSIEYASEPPLLTETFSAIVSDKLFDAGTGANIIARNSSSRIGADAVPMIATIRARPAETNPNYPVPSVGQPVFLERIVA